MNPHLLPFRKKFLPSILLVFSFIGAPSAQSKSKATPYHSLQTKQIQSFSIIHQTDTVTLVQKLGQWLTQKDGLPVDPKRFEKLLGFIRKLTVQVKVPVTAQAKSENTYGLADSTLITLAWQNRNGTRTQVRIGHLLEPVIPTIDPEMEKYVHHPSYQYYFESLPTDPDSTYWQPEMDTAIYITSGNPGFLASIESVWQDRSIFPDFTYENVRQVDVKWRDSINQYVEYKIRRLDDTSAQFIYPKKMPIPRRNAGSIYIRTPQFAVDDYANPNDLNLKFADFENPAFTISIHLMSGAKYHLRTGRDLDGFYYALHPKYKRPVKIVAWRIKPFMRTVAELQVPPPPKDAFESEDGENDSIPLPEQFHPHDHGHPH